MLFVQLNVHLVERESRSFDLVGQGRVASTVQHGLVHDRMLDGSFLKSFSNSVAFRAPYVYCEPEMPADGIRKLVKSFWVHSALIRAY